MFLTLRILLQELQFFSHSLVYGDFAQRWGSSPMETLRGREYTIKQHTQFMMLNMLLSHLASNIYDFLRRATVFLHSLERGCFAQSWCSSPMKTLTGRQCSFQMLTQFTMLNKVQDPLAFNINASLTRAAVLLPFTWKGWFCTKVMLLIQENTERWSVLL
jgi:hypothetical protein